MSALKNLFPTIEIQNLKLLKLLFCSGDSARTPCTREMIRSAQRRELVASEHTNQRIRLAPGECKPKRYRECRTASCRGAAIEINPKAGFFQQVFNCRGAFDRGLRARAGRRDGKTIVSPSLTASATPKIPSLIQPDNIADQVFSRRDVFSCRSAGVRQTTPSRAPNIFGERALSSSRTLRALSDGLSHRSNFPRP